MMCAIVVVTEVIMQLNANHRSIHPKASPKERASHRKVSAKAKTKENPRKEKENQQLLPRVQPMLLQRIPHHPLQGNFKDIVFDAGSGVTVHMIAANLEFGS